MNLLTILLFLYVITKPFYFWASGLPQISDFILIVAFIVVFFTNKPSEIGKIIKKNIHFFLFLIFVAVINLIYSIYYLSGDFNLHTLYYIFDALGIITFTVFFDKYKNSFKHLRVAFMASILVQLAIYISGLGKYYGGIRYMGTFNDPNQFAYFCLLAFSFIYLLGIKIKRTKSSFIYLLITIFLIFESSSTGMFAGVSIFVALYAIDITRTIIKNGKKYIPHVFIVILLLFSSIILVSSIPTINTRIDRAINSLIVSRIEEKINKAEGNSNMSLWEERGYDRIIYYPYFVVFGAGEGNYQRFDKAYHQGELHATLPSILFSYGMIPTILVLCWGYKKISRQKFRILIIYLALIVESFTLINSRQVLFWIIFTLASYITIREKAQTKNEKN